MVAPQILLLGEAAKVVPLTFFGISAIIAGLATLTVPETKDVSLPDTIEETENLCANRGKKKKRDITNEKKSRDSFHAKVEANVEANIIGLNVRNPDCLNEQTGIRNQSYVRTEQ